MTNLVWTLDTTRGFALVEDAMHSYEGIGRLNTTDSWTIRITSIWARAKTCSMVGYWICNLDILWWK